MTDAYPGETEWKFARVSGNDNCPDAYATGGPYDSPDTMYNELVSEKVCPCQKYEFKIADSYGDGICCDWGSGHYELFHESMGSVAYGGEFGQVDSVTFMTPCDDSPVPAPTPKSDVPPDACCVGGQGECEAEWANGNLVHREKCEDFHDGLCEWVCDDDDSGDDFDDDDDEWDNFDPTQAPTGGPTTAAPSVTVAPTSAAPTREPTSAPTHNPEPPLDLILKTGPKIGPVYIVKWTPPAYHLSNTYHVQFKIKGQSIWHDHGGAVTVHEPNWEGHVYAIISDPLILCNKKAMVRVRSIGWNGGNSASNFVTSGLRKLKC